VWTLTPTLNQSGRIVPRDVLVGMTRRWWGGPGISVVLHAGLLFTLIWIAAHPSRIDASAAVASTRTKFVFTVGPRGAGGGDPVVAVPRVPPRSGNTRRLVIDAPPTIMNVDPPPAVPSITTQEIDILPGAAMPVDGTDPRGSGPGRGGGKGPGNGPGDGPGEGPGAGVVYEAGVGGVSDPRLIHEVKPNYTVDAMRGKIQGVVIMEVVVLADGTVDPARIHITHAIEPGLDQQAVIAVRQWRFRPSLRLGQPVASRVLVELQFTLR